MNLLSSLRHRPFALLWTGQTLSRLGDHLYRVALAWWVLEKTGSAAAMGAVLIFSTVPMLLFLLIGGLAVDRLPRRTVMLASDGLRAALLLGVAALAWSDQLTLPAIYAASVLQGFVSAFFQPAYSALVPELTPTEALPSANSLTTISAEISGIAGPALGAILVTAGGPALAFALDGLSFAVAAVLLLGLPRQPAPPAPTAGRPPIWHDFQAGLRVVLGSTWLWMTIAIFSLVNVTIGGPVSVTLPYLVKETLGGSAGALGAVYSAASAGALLTAAWLGQRQRLRHRGWLMYGSSLLGALAVASIGLPFGLSGVIAAYVLFNALITVTNLVWVNTLQELVPTHLMGRVVSIDYLGSFVFNPIGLGLAGWITDLAGPSIVFTGGGLITVVLLILGLLHPAIRNLD